jgi:amino acid transporter
MGGLRTLSRVLVGRALSRKEASSEEITPVEGLSALSLDALTSVAYGPEAILIVLASAGASSLHLILPITIAIVVLLVILVTSYRQVIDAYPHGGGAYAVSRDNFGPQVSKLAGAALIVDYTLTVAVSIAAGVGALTSAFPSTTPYTVEMCLGILLLITALNLRGLGESARAFLVPTFVFIIGLLAVIAIGLVHPLGSPAAASTGRSLVATHDLETVSVFLVLKAFSAGCSALTGVEAIANGVPLFKEPRAIRAKRTELLLGVILAAMLLGLAVLAKRFHIQPRTSQTALSQIMGEAVGRHWAYYVVSLTITLVLALAANTSFGGLPVLTSLLSRDNYLPHLFGVRDNRLVFGNGIWTLSLFSGALLVAVGGNTNTLIPLFAIGVFIGFTLSQSGLVIHWFRTRDRAWVRRAVINGTGALVTASATVIFLLTKFVDGAWVVVVTVPLFIVLFNRVEAYYGRAGQELEIGMIPGLPERKRTVVVVPVTNVSRLTEHALSEAISLGDEAIAVTVVLDGEMSGFPPGDVERRWKQWSPGVELRVLHTDYASIVQPIVHFVDELRAEGDRQVVVLIPVVIPDRLRYRLLHNQIDLALASELRRRTDVVVARVPMSIHPASAPDDRQSGPHDGEDDPGANGSDEVDPASS